MFQEELQKRLGLLIVGEQKPVEISEQGFHLLEKGEGEADLEVQLVAPCILFRHLEKRKLDYFENKKCADYVLFENRGNNWHIHIFELKKTVTSGKWPEIKEQFTGALQNALAIAGVLGILIDFEKLFVYTVYRNDKIKDAANPAKQRFQMHERDVEQQELNEKDQDWNESILSLEFVGELKVQHHKIKLDIENGKGEYKL